METFGLRDMPITEQTEEFLGIGKYASALSAFAENCETPMTIALQGDWGSGKTSLMNLIRSELESRNKNYTVIWFNTWQYAQFGMKDQLAISLIECFMEALHVSDEEKRPLDTLKRSISILGGAVSSVGKAMGGITGATVAAFGATATLATKDEHPNQPDPIKEITRLKEKLTSAVQRIVNNKKGRIIVFIDDLDRLPPLNAVELLENFKIFLDIPGCVFFLACDYKVVTQGLKAKFGNTVSNLNEKCFFDKIIQLPFHMPVAQYDVASYLVGLLDNIGIQHTDKDIEQYQKLIEKSIGFNPRGLKRAFNSLLLLKQVAIGEGFFTQNSVARINELQKLIFSNICMQVSYESLYNYLSKKARLGELNVELFTKLQEIANYDEDEELIEVKRQLLKDNGSETLLKMCSFAEVLFDAMQLESDGNDEELSQKEIDEFTHTLSLSAVTSVSSQENSVVQKNDIRNRNRKICRNIFSLIEENKNFVSKIGSKNLRGRSNIGVYPPKTDSMLLQISGNSSSPINYFAIHLERKDDRDSLYFGIEFSKQKFYPAIDQILPKKINELKYDGTEENWDDGTRFKYLYKETFRKGIKENKLQERMIEITTTICDALASIDFNNL